MTDKQEKLQLIYHKLRNELSYSNLPNICDIPYAIIKGEALSVLAYKTEGMRNCTDIDILISRKRLKDAKNLFYDSGFKSQISNRAVEIAMLTSSHQTTPLCRENFPIDHTCIDLNFDIFWGEYEGKRIDIEEFVSDAIEIEIYGTKVKTLPPIKTMIQLILHQYKDMNSIYLLATRNSIKYDMFKDVYYLLKNNLDTISINRLYTLSAEFEIIPYVFYVLYYTAQVFDDEILKEYIDAFKTSEGEMLINYYGLCAKERKEWRCDFKTRLESENLYELIKEDLTVNDIKKIIINTNLFGGKFEIN